MQTSSNVPSQEGSRLTHRLQKRSSPYTAETSVDAEQHVQSLHAAGADASVSAMAGLNAAVPVAAGPHATGPDAAGLFSAGPDAAGLITASPHASGLLAAELNVAAPASMHTTTDATPHASAAEQASLLNTSAAQANASATCSAVDMHEAAIHCSESSAIFESPAQQQLPASVMLAARPRPRGLRFPWLTNQAGHGSDQVSPSLAHCKFSSWACTSCCLLLLMHTVSYQHPAWSPFY